MNKQAYSPAWGLAWFCWRRRRIGVIAIIAYAVALAALGQAVPMSKHAAEIALIPLAWGLFYLLSGVMGADADLASPESAFPAHMMILPLSSRSLVGWLLLFGIAPIALLWIFCAQFVLRPMGVAAPVGWPAVALCAIVATAQALAWTPLPFRYSRGILAIIVLPAIMALAALCAIHRIPVQVECGISIVLIAVGYALSVKGVSRSRCGDVPSSGWLGSETAQRLFTLDLPESGFKSPTTAQMWFEWRRHGAALPTLTAVAFLMTLPLVFVHQTVRLGGFPAWSHGILGIRVTDWVQALLNFAMLPLLFACVPSGSWKGSMWRQDIKVNTFGAVRPVTTTQFVAARFRVAALSTLAAWAVSGIAIGVALSILASDARLTHQAHFDTLFSLIMYYMTPRLWVLTILVAITSVALTWKFQVDSLFTELSGEPWLAMWVYPCAIAALIPLIFSLPIISINEPSAMRTIQNAIPFAVAAAALIKIPFALLVNAAILRRKLITPRSFTTIVLIWTAVYAVLVATIGWLVPQGSVPAWLIPSAVFLIMPAVRIGLAPLAWEWNRHR